jgi:hypothetical protein
MFEKRTLSSPVPPVISIVTMGMVDPKGGGQAPSFVIAAGPVT